MSTFKVEVVQIDEILPHPGADRLELARIAGWNCVVRKDEYKAGQRVVYIPIDAVLPPELEGKLFPIESKVKLKNSRVRTIKLRGAISQGLVITLEEAGLPSSTAPGNDVTTLLSIKKYEPPVRSTPGMMRGNQVKKVLANPLFHKYTDIENFKYYNTLFAPGEMVYISEKLHGTSARYAKLPRHFNGWVGKTFHRVLRLLNLRSSDYEFCYGSRNVQLQSKFNYKGYYKDNVYAKIAQEFSIESCLSAGEAIYGEIVGDGIQKGYTYGCRPGEHKFFVYDIQINGRWLDYGELVSWADDRGYALVPKLYVGPYSPEKADELRKGDSEVGRQKVREGVVIKPTVESNSMIGRKVLKHINDEYLLKDENTDFH